MTVQRMCELGLVSRASLYRFDPGRQPKKGDLELRDAIQRIALEFPCYGRPRMVAALQQRGLWASHRRVGRIMREDNLLCLRRRKFVITTTDSNHNYRVYPNLARDMPLTAINQLWVADITYIRLQEEFVYLAVILDAFSRRVIGWALDRSLEAGLAIAALKMAFHRRGHPAGLTHHSDRGVQYASNDYTGLLKHHGVRISMSRKGNPYDNATCESFMKTLKYEEVYRQEYRNLAEARSSIACFLDRTYNGRRLHSALGYLPPAKFELSLNAAASKLVPA